MEDYIQDSNLFPENIFSQYDDNFALTNLEGSNGSFGSDNITYENAGKETSAGKNFMCIYYICSVS